MDSILIRVAQELLPVCVANKCNCCRRRYEQNTTPSDDELIRHMYGNLLVLG